MSSYHNEHLPFSALLDLFEVFQAALIDGLRCLQNL
jgi:hypothetical protein